MDTERWTHRAADVADTDGVSAMLSRAFEDDPMMAWIFPDPEARRRKLPRLFALLFRHAHLPHAATDVVCGPEGIASAALWDPPGRWRLSLSGGHLLRAIPGFLRVFGRDIPRVAAGIAGLEDVHPREPHWYLGIIGTDPARQGNGLASRLLTARLDACDAARLPAYLESSKDRNVPFYEKFGFRVTDEVRLPGSATTVWPMWRPPAGG